MTRLHDLHVAADRHLTARPSPNGPSTFDAVRMASAATRAKAVKLRQVRMEREDQASAICLPDLSARAPR
ncbi:hypothetical protein [Aureimonas sp. AU40]|uniref:hypothetical protein n=1 Tax=Aureimonas sp. AU40 TaxID=1637747 RepID=UPI0007815BA5|nr:hypothetical protein [Aureimonas sp. AU40]